MRRALTLALLAAALLPLRVRAQAITAAPGGEMSSLKGMPFSVPIYVDMTQRTDKLGSFAARLSWNPAVLKLDGGTDGTFGSVTANEDSIANGVVHVAGANPAGAGGIVTVGVITFTPLLAQADTLHFSVSELFAAGSFADLMPNLTVHDAYFCPARGMFGDIDKDGAINSRDALIALSNAVGLDVSAFDISLGDVDADGATNARDALIVLSYAVGLPVSQYRVDRIAGGSCATNLPLAMSIVPSPLDLVVGQTAAFEARAADAAGTLQTVTDAIWKTSDASVLAIFPDGKVQARATGTAVVTAIRGTLDSAQATVSVVAHRTRQVVDAAAIGATNQLGSPAFPFATIGQGVGFAQPGDTVEVRVGRYPEFVAIGKPLVLLGDTLGDGSRPVIAADTTGDSTGIVLFGSGPREAHNLALDGFFDGVEIVGPSRAKLAGLRMTNVGNGVIVLDTTDLVTIENSRMAGTGLASAGYGVVTVAAVDTLVVRGSEISDFGSDGIFAGFADSLTITGSHIHDVGQTGVNVYPYQYVICQTCEVISLGRLLPGSTSPALVIDSSTIERAVYLVDAEYFRSASVMHSRLLNPTSPSSSSHAVYLFSGGPAQLVGDSITSGIEWLDASGLTSLTVDSTKVVAPYASAWVDVPVVAILHTQLLGLNSVTGVYVNPSTAGLLTLRGVTVTGDLSCSQCATAFQVSATRTTADSLAFENLYNGLLSVSDSGVAVRHSLFQNVVYPIHWSGSSTAASPLEVTNTTFDGFYDAIYTSGFGAAVDSNTFQGGGGTGVNIGGAYAPVWITRNRFSAVENAISGWRSGGSGSPADSITDNVITGSLYNDIWFEEDSVAPAHVLRNTVVCAPSGGEGGPTGIELAYGDGIIAGNQVTGCYAGLYLYSFGQPFAVSITGNTVTLPSSYSNAAIYVSGPFTATISGNTITGDTVYSGDGLSFFGAAQATGSTSISGNAVRRIGGTGMWLQNPSTLQLQVDSNVVDSASYGIEVSSGPVAITRARIVGSRYIGVTFPSSTADTADAWVRNSYIARNAFGVQGNSFPFHAENNWWGSPLGPSCYAGDTACTVPAGDSVSRYLLFKPFLTDTSTLTVPTAPRVYASSALRAPAAIAGLRAAPLSEPARHLTVPVAAPQRSAVGLTQADRPPRHVSPARMLVWQRMAEHRAAEAGALAQREAEHTAAQAAQETAREVRQREMGQRRADQAARLKVQRDQEASLRAARRAGRQ